jgi:phage gp36-like protein
MAYCTINDIEKMIPVIEMAELTAESGNTPDSNVVSEAIAKADAEIDSYLGVKYTVPFSSAPARVKSLSEDISIYYLYTRRSIAPELREKNYKNANDFLKSIAAGTAVLMAGSTEAAGSSGQAPQVYSSTPVFDRDNMTSW